MIRVNMGLFFIILTFSCKSTMRVLVALIFLLLSFGLTAIIEIIGFCVVK